MSPEQEQFKRHIAFKIRISEILMGKPVMNGEKFSFLEIGNKKIVRVNIAGNIVDKYESQGETKYLVLTLDDGSGQIKLKAFGDDVDKFKEIMQGQTVVMIGVLRHWNNEVYVQPEIIKEHDAKYLLLRKLELGKEAPTAENPVDKKEIIAVKDRILGKIKNSEEQGGIEKDKIILELNDIPSEIINQEVQKFIEEGIVFEPRPGKVRYLG